MIDRSVSTQFCRDCDGFRTFNVIDDKGTYGCVICGFTRLTSLCDTPRGEKPFVVRVRVGSTEVIHCPVWAENPDDAGAVVADFFVRVHGWDWQQASECIERIVPVLALRRPRGNGR